MTSADKIAFMHHFFGADEGGRKCKECIHFRRYQAGNKSVRKCAVYGLSHSEATDWNAGFPACGIINEEVPCRNLYKSYRSYKFVIKRLSGGLDGQITIGEI